MKKGIFERLFSSTIIKLLIGVIVGIFLGFVVNEGVMNVIVTIKHILGQIIFFMVPMIIIGFVGSSIAKLQGNASKLLGIALMMAYTSTIIASLFAAFLGYELIPLLNVPYALENLQKLPDLIFRLDIPPIMSVMSALVFSIMVGIATVWTRSKLIADILSEFQNIVLILINKVLIPILPIFVLTNFCALSYEGAITNLLPVFLKIIVIVIIAHFIWMTFLYTIAALYSKQNPIKLLKHYPAAYLTAVGTMSSAATLGIALKSAKKSKMLEEDIVDFSIPLFANVHLCGSALTEVFFVMVVSQVLYGAMPDFTTLCVFIFLLGIFAVGAPGVPGGTVIASLGIIVSILGFDDKGTALLLTIFALQDSFGTACNITSDGALSMILSAYKKKSLKT